MTLVKLGLFSKNNKQRGSYLYMPIVEISGKYFWCQSIKTNRVISKKDVNVSELKVTREIPEKSYSANGLPQK